MGSDDDDEGGRRRRDKFQSERTDRKRGYDDDRQDTRSNRGGDSRPDFHKRSRNHGPRVDRMPNPGIFQPPMVPMEGMSHNGMGGPRGPMSMPSAHGGMPPRQDHKKPLISRKVLQYDVMEFDEWKGKPRQLKLDETEAKVEYKAFKKTSIQRQMGAIFHACKNQVWFIEQYHPDHVAERDTALATSAKRRLEVFYSLLHEGRFDTASWAPNNRKKFEGLVKDINHLLDGVDQPQPNETTSTTPTTTATNPTEPTTETASTDLPSNNESERKDGEGAEEITPTTTSNTETPETATTKDDEVDELDYEDDAADNDDQHKPKEVPTVLAPAEIESKLQKAQNLRTFSVELFFKTNLYVRDIEKALAQIEGFRRLSCARAMDLSPLELGPGKRRMWATFSGVVVAKVLASLKDVVVRGQGMTVALASRNTKVLQCPLNCQSEESDVEVAASLIKSFDKRANLWQTEDNIVLGGDNKTLEKMVLYLRVVHSFDFFSATYNAHEDGMAQRLGYFTVPNTSVFMGTLDTAWRDKLKALADAPTEFSVFPDGTAKMTAEAAVEEFANAFIFHKSPQEQEIFLCPIRNCAKKFKGLNFVAKHIINKHEAALDNISGEADYFNNYVADMFRCRLLPKIQVQRIPPIAIRAAEATPLTQQQQQQQLLLSRQQQRPLLQQPLMLQQNMPPPMGGQGAMIRPHMGMGPGGMMIPQQQPPMLDKDEFGRDIPLSRRNLYVPVNPGGAPLPMSSSAHLKRSRPTYSDLM